MHGLTSSGPKMRILRNAGYPESGLFAGQEVSTCQKLSSAEVEWYGEKIPWTSIEDAPPTSVHVVDGSTFADWSEHGGSRAAAARFELTNAGYKFANKATKSLGRNSLLQQANIGETDPRQETLAGDSERTIIKCSTFQMAFAKENAMEAFGQISLDVERPLIAKDGIEGVVNDIAKTTDRDVDELRKKSYKGPHNDDDD